LQKTGNRAPPPWPPPPESTTTREAGGLNILASGNCRWQEWAEALWCFDVELAVAPGLGKNPIGIHPKWTVDLVTGR
jgi:hypothetical protein